MCDDNMDAGRESDRKMLLEMPKEELVDLLFLQMRNLWAVDGLYFLGIEEVSGMESATVIDANVWKVMGKIEARRLKSRLGPVEMDLPGIMRALRLTSWALDLEDMDVEVGKDRAILRNPNCRTQNTRLSKGLPEFPCKRVRWDYLRSFARELNPDADVLCRICPPDQHPDGLWCEWELVIRKS